MTLRGVGAQSATAAALTAVFVLCAAVGGAGSGLDAAVAGHAATLRASSPRILDFALVLTWFGSAEVTLPLAVASAGLLAVRHTPARAALLLIAVLMTRLAVDGLKLFFGRSRPAFDAGLIHVQSLSFPSGHAANSMVTYLLLACLMASGRRRQFAIMVAFGIALLVGATRVILAVHWLSDVIAGWSAGMLATLLAVAADRRLATDKQ